MINYDLKFITSDENLHIKNCDIKSYKYETKKRSEESVFDTGKRSYCEKRGGHWRPLRPRQIKQLEAKLRDKTVVRTEWTTDSLITMVFSSGAIAYLTVKINMLDISQVLFDRYFVGKLASQTVTNVALCKSHMLFTHNDRTATLVTFGKPSTSLPCRITDREPSLHCIELGGGTRRTERHLSSSNTQNGARILVWSVTAAEPAPWSPVIEDSANLHLYEINGHNISLIAYHQLENETFSAELSHKQDNIIHIVEQTGNQKNGVNIDWVRYDIPKSSRASKLCSVVSKARASLAAPARAVRRSPCDSALLIACIDGSLHLMHQVAGLTHSTKAGFIATEVHWVNDLIVVAEEVGRIQCFDRALSLLHHHSKCLDLASHLREPKRMQILSTHGIIKGSSIILALFEGGPLTLLRVTHPRLLTTWIRARRISNAVSLLKAMDWEQEGTECLWAVNRIVCAALRSGPEAIAEECSAQAALGSYLAPLAPHRSAAQRFAPPLHDLARKFFHHLLRRGRLEKALSLAVDLGAWDLFCDGRWAARRSGQSALAEEAASLASHYSQIHELDGRTCLVKLNYQLQHVVELARQKQYSLISNSECSESCSDCSSHSYTNSDAETSASSEIAKTKPPPLPRVSLPTLLPVPISQPEPTSTSSIRPNLHQYLDRDDTIWNTEIKENTYKSHDNLKSILSTQNSKWNENGLPTYKAKSLLSINEGHKSLIDIIPRANDDRASASHFRNVFQTELRDEMPNTLYRYQSNNHPTSKDRSYMIDNSERQGTRTEKNKVKFSDTVTIAVMSSDGGGCVPEPARELADSLPLCSPHNYLSAFTPHHPPGTTLDYVEV